MPKAKPPEKTAPAICKAMWFHRDGAGWTQQRLADAIGIKYQQLQAYEKHVEPPLAVIAAAERALGLVAGDILRAAGYVSNGKARTTEQAIASDPRLTKLAREMVLSAYRGVARPAQ